MANLWVKEVKQDDVWKFFEVLAALLGNEMIYNKKNSNGEWENSVYAKKWI